MMRAEWTIISRPWYGYDYITMAAEQPASEPVMAWLLDRVRDAIECDFVSAIPGTVEILVNRDALTEHLISLDLMAFQQLPLAAGTDESCRRVTLVSSYADNLALDIAIYEMPVTVTEEGLKDFALSAFRKRNGEVHGAIDFEFLALGALPVPVTRRAFMDSIRAQAQAGE